MKKVKSLQQVLKDAEEEGIAPETLMADPDDIVEIGEDELENPEDQIGDFMDDE